MRASSIGIRVVTPKTRPASRQPEQQQPVDQEAEAAAVERPTPAPGTGALMDKSL